MKIALLAAFEAITARLQNNGVWGSSTFAHLAPAGVDFPYEVHSWSGGGETNEYRNRYANLLIDVRCIADSFDTAMTGAEQIAMRLDDKGWLDSPGDYLNHTQWHIKTISQETTIFLHEVKQEDGSDVYTAGATYRFIMEEK